MSSSLGGARVVLLRTDDVTTPTLLEPPDDWSNLRIPTVGPLSPGDLPEAVERPLLAPAAGGTAITGGGGAATGGTGGVLSACDVPAIPQTIAPVLVGQTETPTGGTLVDGLYDLVKFEVDDLETAPDAVAIAIEIASSGTIFRFAAQYGDQSFGQEYTVVTDGTSATITTTCPQTELGRTSTSAYSAYDATLIFHPQDGVQTYTRR